MKSALILVFVSILSFSAFAQEQIFVPECEACPEFFIPPYPHSGWWHNSFEPGTGINLDVQNGIAAGNLYAYKEDGTPIWYQFSGQLEQTEDPNFYWTLTNDLYAFSGGQALGGEYAFPENHEIVGTIFVEFLRCNLLRIQVDDEPVRTMSTYMFGASFDQFFEPASNIQAPTFEEGNPVSLGSREAPWIIVQMKPDNETGRYGFASTHRLPHWGNSGVQPHESDYASYGIFFWDCEGSFHVQQSAWLNCGTGEQMAARDSSLSEQIADEEHLCLMGVFTGGPDAEERIYYIRVGDITDRSFIGVSEMAGSLKALDCSTTEQKPTIWWIARPANLAAQAQELWRWREGISEALSRHTPYKNDLSVRVSRLPAFLDELKALVAHNYPEFQVVWFGHLGDGNLHMNVLKPADWATDDFHTAGQKLSQHVFELVRRFDGSVSAEHGVGLLKRDDLHYSRSAAEIALLKEIKRAFDPDGILNPGKMLPA